LLFLKFRRALAATETVGLPADNLPHRYFSCHECAAHGILNHLILVNGDTTIIKVSMLELTNRTSHQEDEDDKQS
jgi:hypothetical protein